MNMFLISKDSHKPNIIRINYLIPKLNYLIGHDSCLHISQKSCCRVADR